MSASYVLRNALRFVFGEFKIEHGEVFEYAFFLYGLWYGKYIT